MLSADVLMSRLKSSVLYEIPQGLQQLLQTVQGPHQLILRTVQLLGSLKGLPLLQAWLCVE